MERLDGKGSMAFVWTSLIHQSEKNLLRTLAFHTVQAPQSLVKLQLVRGDASPGFQGVAYFYYKAGMKLVTFLDIVLPSYKKAQKLEVMLYKNFDTCFHTWRGNYAVEICYWEVFALIASQWSRRMDKTAWELNPLLGTPIAMSEYVLDVRDTSL